MVVKHNISAMNSNRMLGITQSSLKKSTEKLSSGYKINRAADNAAGLAISEKMRKQMRGLTQASANAEDGISAVQTAEGALTEVHDMLQRMNELAVQAANGTNSEDDRSYIQDEVDQLSQEIDRVAETTKFNETYLLKGDTKNQDAMKYTYTYNQIAAGSMEEDGTTKIPRIATATFQDVTDGGASSTGLGVSVVFKNGTADTETSAADQNNLAKALRDQGLTVSTVTVNGKVGFSLELNGSDAKSSYKVVTDDDGSDDGETEATFYITNADGKVVATVTAQLTDDDEAYKVAGKSQICTAYTVTAAYKVGDVYQLYDRDGNAIAANKLDQYFSASEDGKGPGDSSEVSANAGAPKVYDILGKEISAANVISMVTAVKDQIADLKMSFHVGADGTDNNKININLGAMSAKGLGINGIKVNGVDGSKATNAIETISAAIKKVSTQRSALGAVQNRLEHTINNLDNIVENTTAAESAIRDTDMATEMVQYSNNNILTQAGQSMLAQANQSNQGVLSLL